MEVVFKQKAFTLIEFLVAMTIFIIVLGVSTVFFTKFLRNFNDSLRVNRLNTSLTYVSEILNYDLMQAGYMYDDNTSDPVVWDSANSSLTIKFVDDDIAGCENATWINNPSCRYTVIYTYNTDDKSLYRTIIVGATSSGTTSSILPSDISVNNFSVQVDSINKTVSYEIDFNYTGMKNSRSIKISNYVLCRNWK